MRCGTSIIVCLALASGSARGDSPDIATADSAAATALIASSGGAQAAPVVPPSARDAAEIEALRTILEDGRRMAESLTATVVSLPPGPEQDRAQADLIAAKLDSRERMLRALASFALARGDLQEAEDAERALEALRAPVIRATTVSPATKEGGAR